MSCIALVRCLLVLRCDLAGVVWCGIRMQAEVVLQLASGYHTTQAEPQRNTNNIVSEQYNPWNNSTNKSQAPEDGYINIRNMLSIK